MVNSSLLNFLWEALIEHAPDPLVGLVGGVVLVATQSQTLDNPDWVAPMWAVQVVVSLASLT